MPKTINLTQGQCAIVDDEDYPHLISHRWYAHRKPQCDGYYAARNGGSARAKKIFMHRELMSTPRGFVTDHINGDGLDNRMSNLRVCSHSQNLQNQLAKREGSSRYKGVSYYKNNKKWGVNIGFYGTPLFFGLFDSEIAAASKYNLVATELFGEYASLNMLDPNDCVAVHTPDEMERAHDMRVYERAKGIVKKVA